MAPRCHFAVRHLLLVRRRGHLFSLVSVAALALVFLTARQSLDTVQSDCRDHLVLRESVVVVLARTFPNADVDSVLAFLYSLKAQTFTSFEVLLLNSEAADEPIFLPAVKSMRDTRFHSVPFPSQLGRSVNHSYGYPVTEDAMQFVLDRAVNHPKLRFVLITNADNIYHRQFLSTHVASFNRYRPTPCIVGCDFVSRYHQQLQNGMLGPRNMVRSFQHRLHHMDIGSALVRIEAVREAFDGRVRFKRYSSTADYEFFSAVASSVSHVCVRRSPGILFFHQ
jgi:hypothetical protein